MFSNLSSISDLYRKDQHRGKTEPLRTTQYSHYFHICVPSSKYGMKTTSQKSSTSKHYCVWFYTKHTAFQCQSCGHDTVSKEAWAFYPAPTRSWWQHPSVCPKNGPVSKGFVFLPFNWEAVRISIKQRSMNREAGFVRYPNRKIASAATGSWTWVGKCLCAEQQVQPPSARIREGGGKKVCPPTGGIDTTIRRARPALSTCKSKKRHFFRKTCKCSQDNP